MKGFQLALVIGNMLLLASVASAAPYYYFADEAEPKPAPAAEVPAKAAEAVQEAAGKAVEGVQQQTADGKLPQRITGHLSQLYSHGSTAVRGVVDNIQPDIKNIGKDLSDAYQATRSEMGKRIEPLAQTVRPFIDQAQKAVSPYVNSAREEVPKLIHQAGPALTNIGGQVRTGINGVWTKIHGQDVHVPAGVKDVQDQIQAAAEQAKQHVSNTVQAPEAGQALPAAAATAASEAVSAVTAVPPK